MTILTQYLTTRTKTKNICSPLNTEDYIPQPVAHASPAKWQLAHTTWFFEEMILKRFAPNYSVFDESYSFLFNSYYQTIGDRTLRAERGNITRPTVEEVYQYRDFVDEKMSALLSGKISDEIIQITTLGIQHEQQHQELMLTDLKYMFGHNPLFPIYSANHNLVNQYNTSNDWVSMPESIYPIGYTGDSFCFDNELNNHKVYLMEYSIANHLVTNGEYLEFIEDGGYQKFNFWLDDGWAWIQQNNISKPLYWHKIDGKWNQYSLAGLLPLDMDAIICHVSFYEANAFASWKNCRLPTEFEWEAAADKLDWGNRWEWTNSAYLPYPGYEIADGAVGEYNGKFMINQMVLRGASTATSDHHSRKTYRNFFHPHFQWQFSGIRLAK